MRKALLLLLLAAPVQAGSICFYNRRERIATIVQPYCASGSLVLYSVGANYDVSCGISNTFNLFGKLCKDPCASALLGIDNYPKTKGKIVVFGPSVLALGGNNSKWAFAAFEGSCAQLRASLDGAPPKLDPITDDDLIKAAEGK